MGGLVLIPCIFLLNKINKGKKDTKDSKQVKNSLPDNDLQKKCGLESRKTLTIAGLCCGLIFFAATNLQQIGIKYTTVGKAGFITALYIVIVPLLGLFFGKKCVIRVWLSIIIAITGFYLLSIKDGFHLEKSDIYLLSASFLFSWHILAIDYFSPMVDGVKLSCIQFFICGILSGVVMIFTEQPELNSILDAKIPILYAGILSCGVAYTFQILGQKDFNPTIASLILSLESVFSVLAGWLILHQLLTPRELTGCLLIFLAVILAQLPVKAGSK